MPDTDASSERMRVARDLVASESLDIGAALALLNTLPHQIGPAARETVEHAKRAVSAAPGGDHRHQAIARYMIARVLVALERAGASATPPGEAGGGASGPVPGGADAADGGRWPPA